MKFKGTVWLAITFFGIAGYYYFVDTPAIIKEKTDKALSERLLVYKKEAVEEFSLIRRDETITLKREADGIWKLTSPVTAKADSSVADHFVFRLQNVKYSRVVEENPVDLEVYGLKEPDLKIGVNFKNKSLPVLSVGDVGPIGRTLYVKLDSQKRVLLANEMKTNLMKSMFDFRDKTVLDFDSNKINSFQIKSAETQIEFKKENGQWTVAGKLTARGDTLEITNLLDRIKYSKVKSFLDETPEDLAPYGLDSPAHEVVIDVGEKAPPLGLLIGAKNEDDQYSAKTSEGNNVFAIDDNLVTVISKNELDFFDKDLLDFQKGDVEEINLNNGQETINLKLDSKDEWHIDSHGKVQADTATVNTLLFDANRAKLIAYLFESPKDLGVYGLEPPQKELTFITKDEKKLGLKVGKKTNDGKNYFALRQGESTLFILAEEPVKNIFRSLKDLRNKKLLNFKSENISQIGIKYKGVEFNLQKDKDGWDLKGPENLEDLPAFVGKDILWTLNSLEYEELLESPLEDQKTGLDSPTLKVEIRDSENNNLGTLYVGQPVDDAPLYFARVHGKPAIYKIRQRFYEEIPKDIGTFKEKIQAKS